MANASSDSPATPDESGPSDAAIGPGMMVLIVGPSGAGKDALLQGAEARLVDNPVFDFPIRLINRSVHAAERHDLLSDHHLTGDALSRAYPLSWQAHGLTYALPTGINDAIRAGHCVVFNASRTVIETARRRYLNLRTIYIDAPPSIRAGRLAARGRETSAEVRERLEREVTAFAPSDADILINNCDTLDAGIAALAAALRRLADTGK